MIDDKISEKHTYIIKPMKNKRNQNTLLSMSFSPFKTLYTQKWESIGPTSAQSRSGKAVITYRYVGLCRLP